MSSLPVRRLETPTPYPVGPVNAYLIEVEPVTLIDSGINLPESSELLFELIGEQLERLERIVITHAHPDHFGLMHAVADRTGATIHFPAPEIARLRYGNRREDWGRMLLAQGFPLELLLKFDEARKKEPRPPLHYEELVTVTPGDRFEFDGFGLEAHFSPGHTGGHMVYLEPSGGTLFSGDQLLPHVSPNPLMEPSVDDPTERRRSLRQYLDSLEAMGKMELTLAFPGHGEPVGEPQRLIERTIDHHLRRKVKVAQALDGKGQTPFELAGRLYPKATGYDRFLAVSEVVAHLDLVVEDGEAVMTEAEALERYASRR
ncbi:MAG: MBL fold metallo-hydrolase [Actinomycetota bacterium]|nr:MBL fold metallo-hydrolase [Actinomycetota bacterium]